MVAKIEHHIGGLYTIDLGTWSQQDLIDGPVLVYSVPDDQMVIGCIVSAIDDNSTYAAGLYTGASSIDGDSTTVVASLFGNNASDGATFFDFGLTDEDLYLSITGPVYAWTPDSDVNATGLKVIPVANRDVLAVWESDVTGTTGDVEPTWVVNGTNVVVDGTVQWSSSYDLSSFSSARIRLIAIDI